MHSAEFSRESLLEAAGGLECPHSKEKEDLSSVANVADPSSQQNNTQAGTQQPNAGISLSLYLSLSFTLSPSRLFSQGTPHPQLTGQGVFS